MSSHVDPVPASPPPTEEAAPTTQTHSPSAPAAPGYTTSTQIASVGDLQKKAPEVYNAMLQGIAQTICGRMKDHQDRIKKIMRDAQRDANG